MTTETIKPINKQDLITHLDTVEKVHALITGRSFNDFEEITRFVDATTYQPSVVFQDKKTNLLYSATLEFILSNS